MSSSNVLLLRDAPELKTISRALTLTLAAIGLDISKAKTTAPDTLAWLKGVGSSDGRAYSSEDPAAPAASRGGSESHLSEVIEDYERQYIWQLLDRYANNRELAPLLRCGNQVRASACPREFT